MERGAVKGRFAPTPSGRMHLGNLLCALLAWLSARAEGGRVVLRIEDLDAVRSPRSYADLLEDDLRWLGLFWDEGGSSGGPDGPYYQSERTALYQAALARLEEQGLVYPCFCSRAQLHAAQAPHLSDGRVLYPGTCRNLTAQEVAQQRQHRPPALRLRVPDETVSFVDRHLGPYSENLQRECGDFLIRRSDGVFAYQLAVVVDDAAMGVTQVARGADLLSSTPRQLYLYRLLGLPVPTFAHIPLLTAPDGRRLSKRDGDLDLGAIRRRLPGPEPLLGLLGWLCGLLERPEPVHAQDLVSLFSWDKIPKGDLPLPAALWELLG
ncbi:tRNA glutamyl-Q(34) synthetase GluQRS [Bittarella massiliensis]|uniref:tRNA glutamyl-Q(34) synthetase GluQRS n=1 Tax=Bittarella massiliensis (ex Durand et al. 2017) TaxID=1720313 RepID=UPI00163CF961|nr:tRNA glutamyl-Q(34) synthetase GluQRS [Bittarella massiliensis (ex Durand et al. 2017)]MBC2871266.1 tRNA glutamyl-Q(34) synthetase GluQRS [Bittarella massiliensis (ex Durand et al. 2017)]